MDLRGLILAAAAACGLVTSAQAQPAASTAQASTAEIDPAALAAARRVIVAARIEVTVFEAADLMMETLMEPVARQRGLSAANQRRVLNILSEEMRAEPGPLIEMMAIVYARHLSAEDLNTVADFYETPAGQRLLSAQTPMMAEAMSVGQRWGSEYLLPRVLRRLEELSNAPELGPT
jgi:hypothetical protein